MKSIAMSRTILRLTINWKLWTAACSGDSGRGGSALKNMMRLAAISQGRAPHMWAKYPAKSMLREDRLAGALAKANKIKQQADALSSQIQDKKAVQVPKGLAEPAMPAPAPVAMSTPLVRDRLPAACASSLIANTF